MTIKDLNVITLYDADKVYRELGIAFIVKDGQLKGFRKDK